MTELYFGLKTVGIISILGIVLIGGLFLVVATKVTLEFIKDSRKENYLNSLGYERILLNTAAFGDNHTYGYRKKDNDGYFIIIRDSELKGLSLKQIKQKYK